MIKGGDYINIKTKDLTNREFGRLKVLYRTEDKTKKIYRFLVTRGIKKALKEFNK